MNERVMDTWEIEIRVEEEVVSVLPWSSGFGLVSSSLVPWASASKHVTFPKTQ
jgi:hypothetical protein